MNKTRKIYLALLIAFSLCLGTTAYAATADSSFSSSVSNRQFYTPKSCVVQVSPTRIDFSNMKWDARDFGAAYYWEGELRSDDGVYSIADAYTNCTAVTGSLPYLYKEYDRDDVSVGCSDMSGLRSTKTYYASLTTIKGPSFDSGIKLLVESEYGIWGGFDGMPLRYQVYIPRLNTVSNKIVSW